MQSGAIFWSLDVQEFPILLIFLIFLFLMRVDQEIIPETSEWENNTQIIYLKIH